MSHQKIFKTLMLAMLVAVTTQVANAQSGSRGGVSSRSVSGSGGRITGSRLGAGSGSRLGSGSRNRSNSGESNSPLQREINLQNQKANAERIRQQYKQALIQLGQNPNGNTNSQQYRLAFEEAKEEYSALRKQVVTPENTGSLQLPFRLRRSDINRKTRTANWPKVLDDSDYSELTGAIDSQITNGGVTTSEEAKEFLAKLTEINNLLGRAAVAGDVGSRDYARAKRFISGLANEVNATNLVM